MTFIDAESTGMGLLASW